MTNSIPATKEPQIDLAAKIKGQTIKDIYLDRDDNLLIELGSGIYLKFPLTKEFQVGVPVNPYVM